MKKIRLITILLCSIFIIRAQETTRVKAKQIAEHFLMDRGWNQPLIPYTPNQGLRQAEDWANLYLFTAKGSHFNGFVISSAQNGDVIGYSLQGNLDDALKNPAFRWLIEAYNESNLSKQDMPRMEDTSLPKEVAPLLQTQWDQESPYYNLTPVLPYKQKVNGVEKSGEMHCYTGCAATAMAQILKFHEWPKQAKGSYLYKWKTVNGSHSENLSGELNTVYKWALMNNKTTEYKSDESKKAVAELMHDIGMAIHMSWGAYNEGGSAAYAFDVAPALIENFGYDIGVEYLSRNWYENQEWTQIIRKNIAERMPVLYFGATGSAGGHAFVLDGYNEDGFFHVNWGWSGRSDGYFNITYLNPKHQGAGGSIGDGFNFRQEMIANIHRPVAGSTKALENIIILSLPNVKNIFPSSLKLGEKGEVKLYGLTNYSTTTIKKPIIGLGLYDSDMRFVELLGSQASTKDLGVVYTLEPRSGMSIPILFPTNTPEGNYIICPIFKSLDTKEWRKVRPQYDSELLYDVKIKSGQVEIAPRPYVHLNAGSFFYTESFPLTETRFYLNYNVENHGRFFESTIAERFIKGQLTVDFPGKTVNIDENGNTDIRSFPILNTLDEVGTYQLKIYANDKNQFLVPDPNFGVKRAPANLTINMAPMNIMVWNYKDGQYPKVTYTKPVWDKDESNLSLIIKNSGVRFRGKVRIGVFSNSNLKRPLYISEASEVNTFGSEPIHLTFHLLRSHIKAMAKYVFYRVFIEPQPEDSTDANYISVILPVNESNYLAEGDGNPIILSTPDLKHKKEDQCVKIYGNSIHIKSTINQPTLYTIYRLDGKIVSRGEINNSGKIISLFPGCYIIKVGNTSKKIVLGSNQK